MYNSQQMVYGMGATQITVGLSAIVAVRPSAYAIADTMKILSGAGTLWVSPIPVALSGASAILGAGYPVGANEIINISGPATFYMSATGATMIVAMNIGFTSGQSLI